MINTPVYNEMASSLLVRFRKGWHVAILVAFVSDNYIHNLKVKVENKRPSQKRTQQDGGTPLLDLISQLRCL